MPVIPTLPTGMSETELKYHRQNTEAFIRANPSLLTLTPQTLVKKGTGAKLVEGTPRDTQMMRLVDQTRTYGAEPGSQMASTGRQRRIMYQLIGLWDAVIGQHDFWLDDDGIRWEVTDLLPANGYERRAEVTRYGEV